MSKPGHRSGSLWTIPVSVALSRDDLVTGSVGRWSRRFAGFLARGSGALRERIETAGPVQSRFEREHSHDRCGVVQIASQHQLDSVVDGNPRVGEIGLFVLYFVMVGGGVLGTHRGDEEW